MRKAAGSAMPAGIASAKINEGSNALSNCYLGLFIKLALNYQTATTYCSINDLVNGTCFLDY